MAPKAKKAVSAAAVAKKSTTTEVEKALMELELADLNRKLARHRIAVYDYEIRNEELQKAYDKLDEDRADIIAYLKKTLTTKNEENTEMKDKIKGLEELRERETAQFKETVNELEKNFNTMKDQLTSENRLLAGKLNTLEEFRAVREDLMKKFDLQEQHAQNLEMKYKRIIYNTEKKFIIGKDKLKKEMEMKLLDLAQEFQDASELRIAASTHRVLRENIALNNQMDSLLMTQSKVADQNEKFKESERNARVAMEAAEGERDTAINKSIVQLKVIDQLTVAFQNMEKEKAAYAKKVFDYETVEARVIKLTKENENLLLQVRILEQNLHANLCEQNKSIVQSSKILIERDRFKRILRDAAFAVQAAMKVDQWTELDPRREVMDRREVLLNILDIINQFKEIARADSMDSVASLTKVYEKGDLGFVPKALPPRRSRKSLVAPAAPAKSRESLKVHGTSSESSMSTVASELGSVKTMPSVQLVPPLSKPALPKIESIPSFTVLSIKSHESSEEEVAAEEDVTDIERQLEASKLEIQKSLLKDLAYSQMALASQAKFAEEHEKKPKSVVIIEGQEDEYMAAEEGEKVEGEETTREHKDEEKIGEGESEGQTEGKPEEEAENPPSKAEE